MASRASSSSRTTPTSSSTCRRRRRRDATPTARSASPTSASSRSARDRRARGGGAGGGGALGGAARDRRARGGGGRDRGARDRRSRRRLRPYGLGPRPRGRAVSPLRLWLVASRPRTLPAAVAPVLVGTALAGSEGTFKPLRFACALIRSIFIQIGTDLANDYYDARRGRDTEDRLGPVRVTAGGLMPPRQVLIGTYVAFGIAVAAGAYLIAVAGWQLLLVGAASIAAGVLYTGGPKPYGYEGLGELFVFLFFGVVAVVGSYFVQVEELEWEAFALSVPVGLLAAAILLVNNIRDADTD